MKRFVIFLIAIPLLILSGCQDYHEWHQKLTVIVDTPNGEVKGSAVAKVNAAFGQLPMSSNEVNYEVAGEATIVDLGNGRYLFATIDEETKERFYRSDRNRFKGLRRGEWLYEIPKQKDVLTVPLKHYPMLVTFTDINNPASVKLVDPNDLDASFGCSVDGSSTSDNSTSSGNSSAPWLDAGLTWHAYQKQKAKQEIEQREAAFYKQRNALDKKISKLQKEFKALSWKTIAPSGIIQGSEQAAFRKARDELYVSSGYGGKLDPLRKQRVALKASFESKREALIAAPKKGRSTAKDCYSLKSITLEITDEPVTTGKVGEAIPCVKAGRGCNWHNLGLPYSNPLSHLNGAFIRNSK